MSTEECESFIESSNLNHEYKKKLTAQQLEQDELNNDSTVSSPKLKSHLLWSPRIIYKNVLIASFAFLLLFNFVGLIALQSSLNTEGSIGVKSQAAIYVAMVPSCMFLPKAVIRQLGCKSTIVISMCLYIPYIIANFYPTAYTLVPAGFVMGVGAATLWSAKCTYLTDLGHKLALATGDSPQTCVTWLFGLFFMIFQTSTVIGNIISARVLSPTRAPPPIPTEVLSSCGAAFCPNSYNATHLDNPNFERPPDWQVYLLSTILLGSAVAGILLVACALTDNSIAEAAGERGEGCGRRVLSTFTHLRHLDQLLLIPLTCFSGLEQGFLAADFTQSYVGCTLGVWSVGRVLICYGVVDATMSLVTGYVVKYTGRLPVFLYGFTAHLIVLYILVQWWPSPEASWALYTLAGVWGMCDAIWQTQVNAMYGCVFGGECESAFSNYRLWESAGFIWAFVNSLHLCTASKLHVLQVVLAVGAVGYLLVELRQFRARKKNLVASP